MSKRATQVLRWIDAALSLPGSKLAGYADEEDRVTRFRRDTAKRWKNSPPYPPHPTERTHE